MTSNVRSAEAMTELFRPEFLNRIDEIVEFHPLSKEQIGEIVELQLRRVETRLAERGLRLELTDEAGAALAEAGWDPTYGARPLKRAIQRLLENPLALRLLEGEFAEGDTVRVDAREGELVFQKAAATEPARPWCSRVCPSSHVRPPCRPRLGRSASSSASRSSSTSAASGPRSRSACRSRSSTPRSRSSAGAGSSCTRAPSARC